MYLLIYREIARILAAQASVQPFENNCGASAIASKIVAAQVPTSASDILQLLREHNAT